MTGTAKHRASVVCRGDHPAGGEGAHLHSQVGHTGHKGREKDQVAVCASCPDQIHSAVVPGSTLEEHFSPAICGKGLQGLHHQGGGSVPAAAPCRLCGTAPISAEPLENQRFRRIPGRTLFFTRTPLASPWRQKSVTRDIQQFLLSLVSNTFYMTV